MIRSNSTSAQPPSTPRWGLIRLAALLTVLAALAALLVGYSPSLIPPALHPRGLQTGAAQAQLLIDTSNDSQLTSDQVITEYQSYLGSQLALNYALYLQNDTTTATLGRAVGLKHQSIAASGPFTLLLGRTNYAAKPPTLPEVRQIDHRYRLLLDVDGAHPLLTIYAQAPTVHAAITLVDSARGLLQRHVARQEAAYPVPGSSAVVLRPLGPTVGGVVDPSVRWQLMVLVFGLVLVLAGSLMLARRRRVRAYAARLAMADLDLLEDEPAEDDHWPHTKRILPWGLAIFMTMLFLVPFDAIELPVHLPVNGKLDRPIVIALAMLWVASLAVVSGEARPRLKITRVHFALLFFLAICLCSVVLNGHGLSNMDEITLVLKKLALLMSYIVFFFVVASVLRPREVARFAALMVVLGVIVAIGTIIEYRFKYNVFYAFWGKILPITIPNELDTQDSIGRLTVYGPTLQPLELAAMLAMALPFAILGSIDAKTRSKRVLYAIGVGLLLAGGVATARKTSLVVPAAAILILIAYRPRAVLGTVARLAVLLIVLVHFASPAALGSVISQLEPGHLNSALTTTDRTARYDAVTPDVLRHPLMGRGYESYDPQKYRILDNQLLDLLITVGLVGVLAYLAIFGAMMSAAHRTIRGPDPRRASLALAAFVAVSSIAIASALFDVLSFPHVPYLLLFVAAMITTLREPSTATQPARIAAERPLGDAGPPLGLRIEIEEPRPQVAPREPVLTG